MKFKDGIVYHELTDDSRWFEEIPEQTLADVMTEIIEERERADVVDAHELRKALRSRHDSFLPENKTTDYHSLLHRYARERDMRLQMQRALKGITSISKDGRLDDYMKWHQMNAEAVRTLHSALIDKDAVL